MKKAQVISLVNAKGGSGKTTTASNFAFCLSKKGFKVLCIDLDFQCNLSLTLGCEDYNKRRITISELMNFVSRDVVLPDKNEFIVNCFENLDLIPCNKLFDDENMFSSLSGEDLLRKLIYNTNLINDYDFIIVDNHPSNPKRNAALKAVLYASDKLIIPISPDEFDQQGVYTFIDTLIDFIREKQDEINVRIAGLLPTRQKARELMSIDTLDFCKNSGEYTFDLIPESSGVAQSHKMHSVLCKLDPKNPVSVAYQNFTDKYLELYGGEQ